MRQFSFLFYLVLVSSAQGIRIYDLSIFYKHGYKALVTVIQILILV